MRYLPIVMFSKVARNLALWLTILNLGCQDISRFNTEHGESYCGKIVPGGFVRQGFPPGVRLRLHLDTDRIQQTPGTITTDDGYFNETPLRPIPQLPHDSLSTMRFGEGSVRNLLFGVQPKQGGVAYAFLSLLENGSVEIRILRGAPPAPSEAAMPETTNPDLFGIFPLVRQEGTCGF